MNKKLIEQASKIASLIGLYHRHSVDGLESIPQKGSAIIAVNHSLASYDIVLLNNSIYRRFGRIPRALVDRWFFKSQHIAKLMHELGALQGKPSDAKKLLEEGEIICVAPGGMLEAIRSKKERYAIKWDQRKGFAKLAIITGAPVILAACPKADEIYDVYASPITDIFYQKFKLPVVAFRGLGLSILPKPVVLQHKLSEPMIPPSYEGAEPSQEIIDSFHAKLVARMEELMMDISNQSCQ
jgi:hypothetical protein